MDKERVSLRCEQTGVFSSWIAFVVFLWIGMNFPLFAILEIADLFSFFLHSTGITEKNKVICPEPLYEK